MFNIMGYIMKVLRGTLTFVLGMVIGIILFVLAIGGAVVALGTSVTVGQLQSNFTEEGPIAADSDLYNQTILDAVKNVMADIQGVSSGSVSLQTLYQHYGLAVLNGISGIDFTSKDFYTAPVKDILNDLSIVVNSFTLDDVSKLADINFSDFNLPILDDNLDNNVKSAIENIMGSLNGDISVRKIKDNFGIDIGVEDNKLIATLQDVALSAFGAVVNAITLEKLLEVDSDTFIPKGENLVYQKVDKYEEVSKSDLANANYAPALGVETYISGAIDTDNDGTTDKLVEKELRYVKKTVKGENGEETEKYVVDNSCYAEGFSADENKTTYYRHVQYVVATSTSASAASLYIVAYTNRIATFNGAKYTLVSKGFVPLTDITFSKTPDIKGNKLDVQEVKYKLEDGKYEESAPFYVMDDKIDKDSMLRTLEDGEEAGGRKPYLRIHKGTSVQILQIVSNMTVVELQHADTLLDQFTIGDVVDTTKPDTAKAIIALKDCKLSEIGTKINDLKIDELVDVKDESAPIMKALAKRGCTLKDIDTIANKLTIGEVLDIKYDLYEEATDGAYVKCEVYVPYNVYAHGEGVQLYAKQADGTYSAVTAVADGETAFVAVARYRLYNADTDGAATRYNRATQGATALALQQMARRGYTLDDIGARLNDMFFDELVRIESGDNILMKSLSKKDATLDNISEVVNTLKVDEVIEINETSSRLMQSLKARDCLVTELGNISDQLTLAETTDIAFYEYTESANGKYVKVVEDKYVYCDGNEYFGNDRFSKDDEGNYVSDENGKFAKAFYFTLYNPVQHGGLKTYARKTDATELGYTPSSAVLQRMAYSTLGDFSNSFGKLTLGDVMDIDANIYEQDATVNPDTSYFYYDVVNHLFMRQGGSIPSTVTDAYKNYKVKIAGTSSSVIKRLAYVPVDDLSAAMEIVMKDMLLSELVDVYEFSTIESIDATFDRNTSTVYENDRFIVGKVGAEIDSEGNEKPFTYVYDKTGKYIARTYAFVKASDALLNDRKIGEGTFKYQQTKSLIDIASGNIYYYGTKDGTNYVYDHNAALCAYVAYKNLSSSTVGETTSEKLYKRVDGTDYTFTKYKNESGDLYVLINGKYVKYDSSNLAHAGETIYQKQQNPDTVYFVDKSTPGVVGDDSYAYKKADVLYAKQYCENIYVKDANGAYTVINGKAETYVDGVHDSTARYRVVVGYLAQVNEVYNTTSGGSASYTNPLPHLAARVNVENEKSEAVLRMIAREQVTIENINGVIKNAKISDIMDITEGSLFYDFKESKLDDLSDDVEKKFTTMTMGQLIMYADISGLENGVKEVISDITLENFFHSLTIQNGIAVNLEKAYGYKL